MDQEEKGKRYPSCSQCAQSCSVGNDKAFRMEKPSNILKSPKNVKESQLQFILNWGKGKSKASIFPVYYYF